MARKATRACSCHPSPAPTQPLSPCQLAPLPPLPCLAADRVAADITSTATAVDKAPLVTTTTRHPQAAPASPPRQPPPAPTARQATLWLASRRVIAVDMGEWSELAHCLWMRPSHLQAPPVPVASSPPLQLHQRQALPAPCLRPLLPKQLQWPHLHRHLQQQPSPRRHPLLRRVAARGQRRLHHHLHRQPHPQ